MRIIAFPPIGVTGWASPRRAPVRRSKSFWGNGADVVATMGPPRRRIELDLSSLARDRAGRGYVEQLIEETGFGVDPVRLTLHPTNWFLDQQRGYGATGNAPVQWVTGAGNPVQWQTGAGNPVTWFSGPLRSASPGASADGYATITVTGLPPLSIVARPDDVIRVYPAADIDAPVTARAVTVARSDAAGAATIKLRGALPAGIVSLHDAESIVARIIDVGDPMQGLRGDWTTRMVLSEQLPAWIPGDAEEVNPW